MRFKNIFVNLTRRADRRPEDAVFLAQALDGRVEQYCFEALDAALEATKGQGEKVIYPVIDQIIASYLREKPNLRLIADLHNRLPRDTIALQETATEVGRQVVNAMEERGRVTLHPDGYIDLVNNLVGRLLQIGAIEEALSRAGSAVELARVKFGEDQDLFGGRLAQSLENQALACGFLNRNVEALNALQEALPIYRKLAKQNPEKFKSDLARCLNNQVNLLDNLGRLEEAAASAEEAVQIYHQISMNIDKYGNQSFASGLETWVQDIRPNLGDSLLAQSTILNKLERKEESLAAVEEAVDIFETLAQDYPDQFRHHLGMTYNNLAMGLGGLDRNEEALTAMKKSTDIYRELVKIRPEVFRQYLAHTLNGKAAALIRVGKPEEAIFCIQEAIKEYEQLTKIRPESFLPLLAQSNERLASVYRSLGNEKEAIEMHEKAEKIYEKLSKKEIDLEETKQQ